MHHNQIHKKSIKQKEFYEYILTYLSKFSENKNECHS